MSFTNKFTPTATGAETQTEIIPNLKYITEDDYFNKDDFNYNAAQLGHEIWQTSENLKTDIAELNINKQNKIKIDSFYGEFEEGAGLKGNSNIIFNAPNGTDPRAAESNPSSKYIQIGLTENNFNTGHIISCKLIQLWTNEQTITNGSYTYYIQVPKTEGANKFAFMTGASHYEGITELSVNNIKENQVVIRCKVTPYASTGGHTRNLNFWLIEIYSEE